MSTTDRKRVSIACTSCRNRKRKCDGQKPTCGLCEKESRVCEYTHHLEKRKPPTKCYIHALHARIALLEDQLAQSRHNTNTRPTPEISQGPVMIEDLKLHSPLGTSQYRSKENSFFGPKSRSSSAYGHLAFLRKFAETPQGSQPNSTVNEYDAPIRKSPFFLRPNVRDHLLEEFWTWHNTWPLLIHEPLFRKDLSENCANGYSTPTLLASVLALSSFNTDLMQLEVPDFDWTASRDSLVQQVKSSILEQIEYPTLSLVLSAAIASQIELLRDNLASASQYIGIAFRHAMTIGLHAQKVETVDQSCDPNEMAYARSIAWSGVWMLEKHITRIIGQPSAITECDVQRISIPILASMEYSLWPNSESSTIPRLVSYCVSNFQLACDLLQTVTPALNKIFAVPNSMSLEEKEDLVTKTHVDMSVFYNNLPSSLRLPTTATKLLPPHVYHFNILFQALKIMLHRPFICGTPSMESLQNSQNSRLVHLQSATFSAIRVSYIVNSFRNFYPLHRLSPMVLEGLVVASHIHLLNSKSKDEKLSTRSSSLYRLNLHTLRLMAPPGKQSSHAIDALATLAQEEGALSVSDHSEAFIPGNEVQPEILDHGDPFPTQTIPSVTNGSNPTIQLDESNSLQDMPLPPESCFDWLHLPLNDQLLFDGDFASSLWINSCDQGHEYCGVIEHYF